jgi:predicted nucleotidyltransferase
MDQVEAVIREKVLRFYESARQSLPIRKVLLYGSHVKGQAQESSDIDVAVVVDEPDHTKRIEITARLFHAAFQVDPAIEPKCIFSDEYAEHDEASILSEIIDTSVEIV